MANEEIKIKAYKGFDSDMSCRGYQYEIGKEYEMDGNIECCERGFHACESPLEVLSHYFLDDKGGFKRFCEVEQSGKIDRSNKGTKVASSKIKIKAELSFSDLIKLGIEWVQEKTKLSKENNNEKDYAQIGSSGDYAQIGSSGDYARIGSSGDSARIGSSGDYARIGSSGDSARIGSSGYSAQIGSSGDSARIGSSGDYAQINSTGDDSVVCCAGKGAIARAKKGSWITLSEWKYSDEKRRYIPICVKTEQVDGERIKEDTWYKLEGGEFVEAVID